MVLVFASSKVKMLPCVEEFNNSSFLSLLFALLLYLTLDKSRSSFLVLIPVNLGLLPFKELNIEQMKSADVFMVFKQPIV